MQDIFPSPNLTEVETGNNPELQTTSLDLPAQPIQKTESIQAQNVNQNLVNHANIVNTYFGEVSQPEFIKISSVRLDHVHYVFVPPAELSERREDELLKAGVRVFVVYGPKFSGKFTTCLHLAAMLKKHKGSEDIYLYRHPLGRCVPFVHFAQTNTSALHKNAVFISELPLEAEIGGAEHWDLSLEEILKSRSSYFLARSESGPRQLAEVCAVQIDARIKDLQSVLRKYLEITPRITQEFRYQVEARWEEFGDLLLFPAQVKSFCRNCADLDLGVTKESLRNAAKDARRHLYDPREAYEWFRTLGANERLFALLLSLLQGLPRELVEEIYVASVKYLRKDGLAAFRDPREIGLGELLEAVKAKEQGVVREGPNPTEDSEEGAFFDELTFGEEQGIFFEELGFGEEALRQVSNHLPLLRSLDRPFIDLIKQYSVHQQWRPLKALAEALGDIYAWHFSELFEIVGQLMDISVVADQVVVLSWDEISLAVAGIAIGEAFGRDPQALLDRERKLDEWIESGDPQKMFLAGTALVRAFGSFSPMTGGTLSASSDKKTQETLFRILRKLIDHSGHFEVEAPLLHKKIWRERNIHSVANSLTLMAHACPKEVVERLLSWSSEEKGEQEKEEKREKEQQEKEEEKEEEREEEREEVVVVKEEKKEEKGGRNLEDVLSLATESIFIQEAKWKGIPSAERLNRLLPLVRSVLRFPRKFGTAVEPMMRALANWYREEKCRELMTSTLVDLANGADWPAARSLRMAIAEHWLGERNSEVQKLGTELIARSVAIEGFPSELPGASQCMLLVDPLLTALDQDGPHIVARLEQLLGSMVDVAIVPLGATELTTGKRQGARFAGFRANLKPRLVVPALESQDRESQDRAMVSSALVLSWGAVVDLEDALESHWADRLLVATSEAPKEYANGEAGIVLSLEETITEMDLIRIELRLNLFRARRLASMSPELWRPQLAGWMGVDLDDRDAFRSALCSRIVGLKDPTSIASPSETRRILCAVLWLALEDIGACCKILTSLLVKGAESDQSPLIKIMGGAGTCMLFRVFSCADPLPDPKVQGCLFQLADLLVDLGWSSVVVALFAVRRWLEDERWRNFLVNGHPQALRTWLGKIVASRHDAELLAFLDEWREPLDPKLFPKAEIPPAIVVALADEMTLRIAEKRAASPALPTEGHQYGLVVVGSDSGHEPLRELLTQLAAQVVEQGRKQLNDIVWLIHRCGRSRPIVVIKQGDEIQLERFADQLFCKDGVQRPELLEPLVALRNPSQVRFALLLKTRSISDQADLESGPWTHLLHVYPLTETAITSGNHGFYRVPWLRPTEEHRDLKIWTKDKAGQIVQHLARTHPPKPKEQNGNNFEISVA